MLVPKMKIESESFTSLCCLHVVCVCCLISRPPPYCHSTPHPTPTPIPLLRIERRQTPSGVLRVWKLRFPLSTKKPELSKVLSLKPVVGQNIALLAHLLPDLRNFYLPSSFSCICCWFVSLFPLWFGGGGWWHRLSCDCCVLLWHWLNMNSWLDIKYESNWLVEVSLVSAGSLGRLLCQTNTKT